jgi:hypothetical protein
MAKKKTMTITQDALKAYLKAAKAWVKQLEKGIATFDSSNPPPPPPPPPK